MGCRRPSGNNRLSMLDVRLTEKYEDEVITLTGYIGESIPPDEMFASADLRDHPSYGNSEHQLKLNIRSKVGSGRIIIKDSGHWYDCIQPTRYELGNVSTGL